MRQKLQSQTFLRRLMLYWAPLWAWMATIEQVLPSPTVAVLVILATAHAGEFGVLAVLIYRLLTSYRLLDTPYLWTAVLALAAVYGATDELHQSFVPGRDPSWLDLGYDSMGAVLGLLAARLVTPIRRRLARGR